MPEQALIKFKIKYITNKGCLNGILIPLLYLINRYIILINAIIRVVILREY